MDALTAFRGESTGWTPMNYDERRRKKIIPNMPNASNDKLVGSGTSSVAVIVPGEFHWKKSPVRLDSDSAPTLSAMFNPLSAVTLATGFGEELNTPFPGPFGEAKPL